MAWFDPFAKEYDAWYETKLGRNVLEIERKLMEGMVQPTPGQTVLDLGAGTGMFSFWLAEKGLHVTAFDQSTAMLEIARHKAEHSTGSIDFIQGDAHELPFQDDSFDRVISVTALEFMDDPKKVLAEAWRVLKPGGRLVVGVLAKHSPWGELYRLLGSNPNSLFSKAHLYTEGEIEDLLPVNFRIKKGLYLLPVEEFDEADALDLEDAKQNDQADGAGFYVICWKKENAK